MFLIINILFALLIFAPSIVFFFWIKKRVKVSSPSKAFGFKALWAFGLLLNCTPVFWMVARSNENQSVQSAKRAQEANAREQEYEAETLSVANQLLQSLRSEGVNESLISDVKPNGYRRISVVVTNEWFKFPQQEQKQMKQTIGLLLKKIRPPDGYPFDLMDFMGNKL